VGNQRFVQTSYHGGRLPPGVCCS